jgi:hypothetical protein
MKLLDPTVLTELVDFSFGDQSGDINGLWNRFMSSANLENTEFIKKYNEIKLERNFMTLFIDNIRLYQSKNHRYTNVEISNLDSRQKKDERISQLSNENLLLLCSHLPDMNFIIFTGFEDTAIDDNIYDNIPKNVIHIYASNSISFGGKVSPIPYGLQRKLNPYDNRHIVLMDIMNIESKPEKLLYINHNISSNPKRIEINNKFSNLNWVTISSPKSINPFDYKIYLNEIKNHKFMICPEGNAIGCECHRDWEVIYMKRVPIVLDTPYLRKIFENIPVLFVNSFLEITEELLISNNHLYDEMQLFDVSSLDFEKIFINIIKKHKI